LREQIFWSLIFSLWGVRNRGRRIVILLRGEEGDWEGNIKEKIRGGLFGNR